MHSKAFRSLWLLAAVGVVLLAGSAQATVVAPVPEVSPSSMTAGLAALAGGILVLRSWRRR